MAKTSFSHNELSTRLARWGLKKPANQQQYDVTVAEFNFYSLVSTQGPSRSFTIKVKGRPLTVMRASPDSCGLAGHRDFYAECTYNGDAARAYFIGKGVDTYTLIVERS